jgi:hypothetical protein
MINRMATTPSNPFAQPNKRRWIPIIITVCLLLVGSIFAIDPYAHGHLEVCHGCGQLRRYKTLFDFKFDERVEATPVSKLISAYDLCDHASHDWGLVCSGGLIFRYCGLGSSRHVGRAVEDDQFANVIESRIKYEGRDAARPWLRHALSPECDCDIDFFMRENLLNSPIGSRETYDGYWNEWGELLSQAAGRCEIAE